MEFFLFTFVGIVPFNAINLSKHQQKARLIELTKEQIKNSYNYLEDRLIKI